MDLKITFKSSSRSVQPENVGSACAIGRWKVKGGVRCCAERRDSVFVVRGAIGDRRSGEAEVVEMLSAKEVYENLMVSSRSGERLSVPNRANGGLMASGVGGIRYAKVSVADGAVSLGSNGQETTAMDVKNMAMDAQPEAVREGDREGTQKVLRFQSEVVTRGGPRLLSHRVRECSRTAELWPLS